MILRRLGTKKHIAHLIYPLFKKHSVYIEPFFGAGGMFFQKPRAKYNILNDIDNDVFNLWQVIQKNPEALYEEVQRMIIHESLLKYWRKNQESEPVKKAVRFLMLNNFTLLGTGYGLRLEESSINAKRFILEGIHATNSLLTDCIFSNKDAVNFLKAISKRNFESSFIYCDPPYVDTVNNYNSAAWSANNLEDLILALHNTGAPFAISEYENSIVSELAQRYNLYRTHIKNRRNLTSKKRATEVLLTNYVMSKQQKLF